MLLPIWRPISRFAERHKKPPTGPVVGDPPPPGTIRPLVKPEFDRLAARFPYYRNRWAYTSVVCDVASEIIDRHALRSALELGPFKRSTIVGADVMDRLSHPDLELEGRLIVHDATVLPWPIADQAYDLFVGLQVFEHLDDRQAVAFGEVRRIARHAIISLPIDWEMKDPTNVHHQISHEKVVHAKTAAAANTANAIRVAVTRRLAEGPEGGAPDNLSTPDHLHDLCDSDHLRAIPVGT